MSSYEIDGLIITNDKKHTKNKSGNPKYAVAFKSQLDEQIEITTVTNVEWNPSKRGILVPRIKLKPIKIGGDTITFTTGFNAKYIKDNNIGIGTRLKMIKSGDVIPYILEVLTNDNDKNNNPITALFPSKSQYNYRWVKPNNINIELVNKDDSDEVLVKKMVKLLFNT